MSLRDQLLKAGLADKKKVQQVNRELKQQRKQEQADLERKSVLKAREAEAARVAADARLAERQAARHAAEQRRELQDRRRQVANLTRAYRIRWRTGAHPFYLKGPDGRRLLRLTVPETIAMDLRAGLLAICWLGEDPSAPEELLVLPADAAARVELAEPGRRVFWNDAAPSSREPAEALLPTHELHEATVDWMGRQLADPGFAERVAAAGRGDRARG